MLNLFCRRLILIGIALCLGLPSVAQKKPAEDSEVKMGRDAAAENDKQVKLIKEQNKMQSVATIAAALVAILGKGNLNDVGTMALAGQLYMVAKLNSYGVEAEKDADQSAVRYLLKTKYNPVGILTFMERL